MHGLSYVQFHRVVFTILLLSLISEPGRSTEVQRVQDCGHNGLKALKANDMGYLTIGGGDPNVNLEEGCILSILSLPAKDLRDIYIWSNISIVCDGESQEPILFENLTSIGLANCQVDTNCWEFSPKLEKVFIRNVDFRSGNMYDFFKIPPNISTLTLSKMGKINLSKLPNRGNLKTLIFSSSEAGCSESNSDLCGDCESQEPILFENLTTIVLENCQVDINCWGFSPKLEYVEIFNVDFRGGSMYDFLRIPPNISTLYLSKMGKINLSKLPNRGNLKTLTIHISEPGCSESGNDICDPPVEFENVEEFYLYYSLTNATNFNFSRNLRNLSIQTNIGTNFNVEDFYDFLQTIPWIQSLIIYVEGTTIDISRLPTQNLRSLYATTTVIVSNDQVVFGNVSSLQLGVQGFPFVQYLAQMFPVVKEIKIFRVLPPPELLSVVQLESLQTLSFLFDFIPPRRSFEFGECMKFLIAAGYDPNNRELEGHYFKHRVFTVNCERKAALDWSRHFSCEVDWSNSNIADESVEDSKSLPIKILVFLYIGVLYIIIGFGFLGNGMSAFILIRAKMMKTSSGLVLLSLTLSDSLIILTYLLNSFFSASLFYDLFIESGTKAEVEVYAPEDHVWITEQNELQAYILYPINKTAYTASVYLTVLISLERFIAVCFPLKSKVLLSLKNSRFGILTVWVLAAVLNSPRWIESYEWDYYDLNIPNWNEYYKPTFMRMRAYTLVYHRILWPLLMYFLPFILIGFFNYRIVKQMRLATQARKTMTSSTNTDQADSEMASLTKMLLAIVALFVICNVVHICIVLYFFLAFASIEPSTIEAIAGLPIIINSSVNFIIYVGMGKRFRNEFIKLIPQWVRSCASQVGLVCFRRGEESASQPTTEMESEM